jgi:hypothetical protein
MDGPLNQSLRCELIQAIGEHFSATIKRADGYTNDIGDRIKLGTSFLPSGENPPYIVVFEHIAAAGEDVFKVKRVGGDDDPWYAYTVLFDVSGWGPIGTNKFPALGTYELMADVKKAIAQITPFIASAQRFHGLDIIQVDNDPGIILPQAMAEQKTLAPQFVVQMGVQIAERGSDPYQLHDDSP